MSDIIKDELAKWKQELESEKAKNIEEVNRAAEEVSVAKAKYYVTERVLDSMENGEERESFYDDNVKHLEDTLDLAEQHFEQMKSAKGIRNAHIDLLLAEIEMKLTS